MELFLQGDVPFRQILNGTTSLFLCLIWLMSGCQKTKTKNIIAFIIFIGIRWRALLSARSIAVCELPLSCFSLPAGRNKKQPLLLLLQELPCIKNTVSSNIWREKCKKLMKSSFKKIYGKNAIWKSMLHRGKLIKAYINLLYPPPHFQSTVQSYYSLGHYILILLGTSFHWLLLLYYIARQHKELYSRITQARM